MTCPEDGREQQRRFMRRNWFWLVPLGVIAGAGLFIGLGFLVAWLWRVTVGDIFGLKPISFWQAWGLILLSQILFKANMHRSVAAGPTHRRRVIGLRLGHTAGPEAAPAGGEPEA